MSLSFPLDSATCTQADDVFYCLHADDPSLFDAAGHRLPLSADDPDQQHLREHWCELYEEIDAHHRDGSRPFPICAVAGHQHHDASCPHCAHPGGGEEDGDDDDDMSIDPVPGNPVEPIEGCPCQEDGLPPVRLRLSIFFDGTGNNRANVDSGAGTDESYTSGHSNIARLERAGIQKAAALNEQICIYVEGIGTVTGGADDTPGYATGMGHTGVLAKVEAGRAAALAQVCAAADAHGSTCIEYLHIDAFGFSRGGAAARNFIHATCIEPSTLLKTALEAAGYQVGEVVVKFIGLFDTVSSYGVNHYDDTAELHLDSIAVAEQVVQLAAAEEHRMTFQLTDIRSAGTKGTQIFLPGVHSDVGGGYADFAQEVDVQLFDIDFYPWNLWDPQLKISTFYREKQWLIDSGWYREDQLRDDWQWQIFGTRPPQRHHYAYIPLHMMAAYARNCSVPFKGGVEASHPIPSDLLAVQAAIWSAVSRGASHSPSAWFGKDPADDPDWHRKLRNHYLHFSAQYGYEARMFTQRPNYSPWHPVLGPHPAHGRRARGIRPG